MKVKNKLLHVDASFKSAENEDGSIKITGYASTNDKDRAGDVIVADAWSKGGLVDYKKNPIILFNHNYDQPIGRATALSVNDKGLSMEATISSAAGDVLQLIKDKVLGAFSVGFMIKDANYDSKTDIFVIKEAELYEVSVVSVPCNQDATFSLAKAFDSEEDFNDYKKDFIKEDKTTKPAELSAEDLAKAQESAGKQAKEPKKEENTMTPEEIKAMLEKVAKETAANVAQEAKAAAEKEVAEKAAKEDADKKFDIKVKSSAEALLADIEKRFSEKNESLESIVGELKEDLVAKAEEIAAMRENKRVFENRGTSTADWKKTYGEEATDSFILGLVTGKGSKTKFADTLIQKVNTDSGVEVSSEDFEQVVSTNLQRDIEEQLVIAPMFREIQMNAASMILPIMPDAGYAEFVSGTTTDATAPKGNLDMRSASFGDEAGVDLGQRILTTSKIMSVSYLGNETEEDAILPIVGLIREAMVRSHARTMEQTLLLGNHTTGIYTTGAFDGLITMADADSHQTAMAVNPLVDQHVAAADLMGIRKNMGKYGLRPEDVVYLVSQRAYYELIEDAEFQDANLVGEATATKLKGKIGSVYGSNVVVCPEFVEAAAVGGFVACAVNTRNYLMPRLRGLTVESEYQTVEQRRALVATQRIGFTDIINGAASVWGLQYGAIS